MSILLIQFSLGITLWWILAAGRLDSFVVGIPVVIVAVVVERWLGVIQLGRFNPVAALGFGVTFVWGVILAGVDIARRVMRPVVDVDPANIPFTSRLPQGIPQLLFVHAMNLQPGTVCVVAAGDLMTIYVLDSRADHIRISRRLEDQIAGIFGMSLADVASEERRP